MPSLQEQIVQEDYSAGMVRDVAPHLIPQDGAYDILNGLLNEDGSIYRRGGSERKSVAGFGSSGMTYLWDGFMSVGQRTLVANSADFGVLASDDETITNLGGAGLSRPRGSAYLAGLLFIGGGFVYGGSRKTASYTTSGSNTALTNGSKVVTDASGGFTANVDAGMLLQRGDERVYVVESVDSDTQLTLRDAYEGATTTSVNVTLHNIYAITASDPYEASEHYAVCANRLCWFTDNLVRFSEINAPHDTTNQFGTDNEHEVPEGQVVLGLGSVGQALLIFTSGGVWTLQGLALDIVDAAGNPNHRLQVLSRDLILWGQQGIAAWEQVLVVPCASGVYLMDGISRPVLLSQSVSPLLDFYVDGPYRPGGAEVYRNHLFLPVLDSTGAVKDLFVCRLKREALDRRRRAGFAWTHFSGTGGRIAAFAVRYGDATSPVEPLLLGAEADDSSYLADLSAYLDPDIAHKADADGTAHQLDITSRDFETGSRTLNTVRKLRSRYELVDAGTDNPVIKFSWSDGNSSGLANWGEVNWGEFNWNASGASFFSLMPDGPEDNGQNPHNCRVNKKRRYIRVRARNSGPCASYVHRSFEIRVRPSQAVRK